MAPRELARFARTLSPPTVADDLALRKRRALSLKWIEGGRELLINGRLPLEQGAAFEAAIRSAAKAQRALDKKHHGETLDWQQSAADALVTLTTRSSSRNGNANRNANGAGSGNGTAAGSGNGAGAGSDNGSTRNGDITGNGSVNGDAGANGTGKADGHRSGTTAGSGSAAASSNCNGACDGDGCGSVERSNVTLIVHLSEDEPPFIEGGGTISPETADYLTCDARRLFIKPHGRDLLHSRVERCATYAQLRALLKRSKHCQYPGCSAPRELHAHHLLHVANGGLTLTDEMILLCTHHHKHVHDHHIHTTGTGHNPVFTGEGGRLITAGRPHAPPA
jgi:hypothetical protein